MLHPKLRSFRNFLRFTWAHLGLPEPTPVQLDIADFLQYGPKRFVIEAFRGIGKSWITSAFVVWCLAMDPDMAILVVSASKIRADDFTTFTLRLISEMDCLNFLLPKDGQRMSRVSFDVGPAKAKHSPSVKSVGITGQLAGSRAGLIIADDIEVPNNSQTQVMREKLSEAVKEFDAIITPGGRIGYLGTPQTEQSIYNALGERGYEIRVWPARMPRKQQRAAYGERLAPFITDLNLPEDSPTDPKRFSTQDLLEREASYGRSGFALQFMLDTSLSDQNRYPLKVADLIVSSVDVDRGPEKIIWANGTAQLINDLPNVAFSGDRFYGPMEYARDEQGNILTREWEGSILSIDPSGRGKDETGYAVTKVLHGQVFVPECGGFRGGYEPATLQGLAEIAKTHKVNKIIVEPNFGDGMFNQLLAPVVKNTYPCTIEDAVRSNTQKEKRIIDTLEPVMNQHKLIIDRRVIQKDFESTRDLPPEEALKYQLIYQMTRITKDKGALIRDDRLDALAIGVAYWTELMNRDIEEALQLNRQEALERELARFMDHAIGTGYSRRGNVWKSTTPQQIRR